MAFAVETHEGSARIHPRDVTSSCSRLHRSPPAPRPAVFSTCVRLGPCVHNAARLGRKDAVAAPGHATQTCRADVREQTDEARHPSRAAPRTADAPRVASIRDGRVRFRFAARGSGGFACGTLQLPFPSQLHSRVSPSHTRPFSTAGNANVGRTTHSV